MTKVDPAARYVLRRLGIVMRADPRDPAERLGVLNPATARDSSGTLYLFPRIVAEGNFSRIARCRVLFDDDGVPTGVDRQGVVLEPSDGWEMGAHGGGVEDPRITRIDALGVWLMTYTAHGPLGPKIGMAASDDLTHWQRLGPAAFTYEHALGVDFNLYPNKDSVLFPELVRAPDGRLSVAMLHRPSYDLWSIRPEAGSMYPRGLTDLRQSIWASFAPIDDVTGYPTRFEQHTLVAGPEQEWERVKIGAGPPPIRTDAGWLLVYHGVAGELSYEWPQPHVRYSAGAMMLAPDDVTRVLWRDPTPLLQPDTDDESSGIVPHVVFPTAVDPRSDGSFDIYYGMADDKIGVARLEQLKQHGHEGFDRPPGVHPTTRRMPRRGC